MPPYSIIQSQVSQALAEDIGSGDITAALIPKNNKITAHLMCREKAVLCGTSWFDEVFRQLKALSDTATQVHWHVNDGENITEDQCICTLNGNAQAILTGERTAMNFLQTLSGTATITAEYVKHLEGSQVKLLDTRKTIPGLREAQKYAVRCGGGYNHRHGLFDGILIKENHIMAAGSISLAIQSARDNSPHTLKIEVEVETLEELQEALTARADILLLDNMSNKMLEQAVQLNQLSPYQAKLEVSGNVTYKRLNDLRHIGIDYISTGAITKHLTATDFSLRFEQ
ncbi:MAG: carboxylating nicotinate-nucleotide diphosphorylase [gamma proteobacterium symbiont of Bathyaustriella thionipta]|nr:carboxylating nicotinate-nucleotide diphosphorylase [gamma proteobacterium symbiont of Bathyaustriella thionipta]MCU7949512.1 carboxylating nicotinate-nucleotide diphosphorylase [gamma proteobacterium symbiont of Bathyaustriella thionipta]MCU7954147.1 carboxylating nicotinate-nucleotide diphosphorylase [gamma proteobacterium symbiont of Bathyaustriella thionipta]MCU7956098.1 carboxylating nicotinate-nucleotide diphosphorylase [gamma proteobacterium symbiont of Bathyaustriella thionipta]MCU79